MASPNDTKKCSTCHNILPLSAFGKSKSTRDGLMYRCHDCNNAHVKAYYAANSDKVKAYQKKYNAENPEKVAAGHAKWREENKHHIDKYRAANAEAIAANKRAWRKDNPDKVKKHKLDSQKRHRSAATERTKRWRERHPDKSRMYGRVAMHRRNHAPGKFTNADIELQRKAQTDKRGRLRCWWCSEVIETFHIDHRIALARGGSNDPSNLCLACPDCNMRKQDKLPGEWNGRLL